MSNRRAGGARVLINVDVPDLKKGEAFYTAAFGLTVSRRLGDAGLELTGAEVPIYLLEKAPGSRPFLGAPTGRSYERHWAPMHLDFVVDDIAAGLQRALEAGALQESDVGEQPWGKMVLMSDPFGNGVCLLWFNEKGYDAIAEG